MITRELRGELASLALNVSTLFVKPITPYYIEEKPATFINKPLSRANLRKRLMRKIKKSDINWRDTAFLAKFMNDSGKMFNKW
jgi:hypothetical protein